MGSFINNVTPEETQRRSDGIKKWQFVAISRHNLGDKLRKGDKKFEKEG